MLKKWCVVVSCVCLLLCPAVLAADADTEQANAGEKAEATPEAAAVDAVALAAALAQQGRDSESPALLIAAAELLSGISEGEAKDRAKETRENEGAGEAGEKADAEAPALTVAALLADARQLAGGDEALGQLITRVEQAQQGAMGRYRGPGSTVTRVNAYSTDIFNDTFTGGRYAQVCISGDGDTDLDLYVFDENGNLIGSSTSYGDDECVSWTPRWTGRFRIEVRNLGRVWNQYRLWTN
jgi:hypothetical protein